MIRQSHQSLTYLLFLGFEVFENIGQWSKSFKLQCWSKRGCRPLPDHHGNCTQLCTIWRDDNKESQRLHLWSVPWHKQTRSLWKPVVMCLKTLSWSQKILLLQMILIVGFWRSFNTFYIGIGAYSSLTYM